MAWRGFLWRRRRLRISIDESLILETTTEPRRESRTDRNEKINVHGRRNDSVTVSAFLGTVTIKNSSERVVELRLVKMSTGL